MSKMKHLKEVIYDSLSQSNSGWKEILYSNLGLFHMKSEYKQFHTKRKNETRNEIWNTKEIVEFNKNQNISTQISKLPYE